MTVWQVRFERAFDKEVSELDEEVRVELLSHAVVLEMRGPSLGRPLVDTLSGSAYANMKEMRFNTSQGVWRVAFAFDEDSRAILLVAGNKAGLWGKDEKRFYKALIKLADARFRAYLERVRLAKSKKDAKARSGKAKAPGKGRLTGDET